MVESVLEAQILAMVVQVPMLEEVRDLQCHVYTFFLSFLLLLTFVLFSVDCQWSNWGQWEKCIGHCGIGRKVRRRTTILTAAKNGGNHCYGADFSEEPCPLPPCETVSVDINTKMYGEAHITQSNTNADVTNMIHSYENQNNQNYGNQNNQQIPNLGNPNGNRGNFGIQYNPNLGNLNYPNAPYPYHNLG